jgi:hypothetical protein
MRDLTESQLNAAREANRTADELCVLTERQLNEAREANRIAAEALALQLSEAEARDQYHLRVIPQNDDVILINGGRFDVKILEMRLLGPGATHAIQIPDNQWLSPFTYESEFFIRAGGEGRVLNATPDRYVLVDERFTLRMRVWLDNAHRILEFTGIRQWDQLRLGNLTVTTDLNQSP